MVEALARVIVFTSLRSSGSSVGPSLALSSTGIVMGHSVRSFVRPDFFTPHPRHATGKEKSREVQEYEWGHCIRHHFRKEWILDAQKSNSSRQGVFARFFSFPSYVEPFFTQAGM
jgi:hypothetical protein